MSESRLTLFKPRTFARELIIAEDKAAYFRETLQQGREQMEQAFKQGLPVADIIKSYVKLMDFLLCQAYTLFALSKQLNLCLIAVGGYGRSELFPYSDIDLLVLTTDQLSSEKNLEKFICLLWDMGLEVGHSVRTLEECALQAKKDCTVFTNILENRYLAGHRPLHRSLLKLLKPGVLYTSQEFFENKVHEQEQRYEKYERTAYHLEPNIKKGPGGLRDIHVITWISKFHFGGIDLSSMLEHRFINQSEYKLLTQGQNFLCHIRFALHLAAKKREDRLLFDFQIHLAESFHYVDKPHVKGIELFMRDYFRHIKGLRSLNDLLLQLFREMIIGGDRPSKIKEIDENFLIHDDYLAIRSGTIFKHQPETLLTLFVLLSQHPEIKGVRAKTIRSIRRYRHLVNEDYRNQPKHQRLFLEIFKQKINIAPNLQRMVRYGILENYLPEFARVVGQMQYDLYHIYTVDQHTIFLIRNLCLFRETKNTDPLCHTIMLGLPNPEVLLIAAFYHDIGKGSGQDHSLYGAQLVEHFSERHNLSQSNKQLASWLVQNHLLMSQVAQRKDINDPDIVNEFARKLVHPIYLEYLYLLTVADIKATNPALWNSWRDSLLKQLYHTTKRALPRIHDNPISKREIIHELQQQAMQRLIQQGIGKNQFITLWDTFSDDYFLRESEKDIAHHTALILSRKNTETPLLSIRNDHSKGGTEVFIHTKELDNLFANCVITLDRLGLNILEASINTSTEGYSLDTYIVLDQKDKPLTDKELITRAHKLVLKQLNHLETHPSLKKRRLPRQLKHFELRTEVNFETNRHGTQLQIIALDRPGLLARIAKAFNQLSIKVSHAKIFTHGERAEDIFYITNENEQPLDNTEQQKALEKVILDNIKS